MKNKKEPLHQFDISRLKNAATDVVIKDKQLSEGFKNPVVPNVTEHINNKEIQKKLTGNEFLERMANLRAAKAFAKTAGKKVLGAVPIVGGIAQAVMSQDASAAVPFLGDSESLGPAPDSLDARIENGTLTDEDKAELRKQALQQIGK